MRIEPASGGAGPRPIPFRLEDDVYGILVDRMAALEAKMDLLLARQDDLGTAATSTESMQATDTCGAVVLKPNLVGGVVAVTTGGVRVNVE